jgi:type IV pilus assembly protein PilM
MAKEKSYLGVDIGAHGIKIVELKNTKNRPQLWTYGILEKQLDIHLHNKQNNKQIENSELKTDDKSSAYFPQNQVMKAENSLSQMQEMLQKDARINEYAEMLKTLVKKSKVSTKYASSSLPVSQVFHTVINLPKVEEKAISSIVKAEVAKMIPYPIEEMQVIPQKIPVENKNGNITVLVTAAPKVLISFYSNIFSRAGLQLMELETEAFALTRSLVGHDTTVSMIIDIGAERTNFFIIDNATPMTYRSLHIGGNDFDKILATNFGFDESTSGNIKNSLSVENMNLSSDSFLSILGPIVQEIKYILVHLQD